MEPLSEYRELRARYHDACIRLDERRVMCDEKDATIKRLSKRLEELNQAIAEAMESLSTGPMKDGYAYTVLDEATS